MVDRSHLEREPNGRARRHVRCLTVVMRTARPLVPARRRRSVAKAAPSTKHLLELFLVAVYRGVTKAEHATPIPLRDIATELGLSENLAEKVAEFLESQGLIDYDDQAVDITIPGMIRTEELLAPTPERTSGTPPRARWHPAAPDERARRVGHHE